jgi:hypothetical protein
MSRPLPSRNEIKTPTVWRDGGLDSLAERWGLLQNMRKIQDNFRSLLAARSREPIRKQAEWRVDDVSVTLHPSHLAFFSHISSMLSLHKFLINSLRVTHIVLTNSY